MSARARSQLRAFAAVLLACAALACANEPGSTGSFSTGDSGIRDSGNDFTPHVDGSRPQGDAGHQVISGETHLCRYDDEDVRDLAGNVQLSGLSTATDQRGFALLHHDAVGALMIEALELGEEAQPPVRLIDEADAPGRALLAASQETFAMLWQHGATLSFKVLEGGAETLTLSQALPEDTDALFAIAALEDGFVVAFAERDGSALSVHTQRLGRDGATRAEPSALELPDGVTPRFLQLATLEDDALLLAWSEQDPDDDEHFHVRGVSLQRAADDALAIAGQPQTLSKSLASSARFELDSRVGSVGLLYATREGGIRESLKLQRVESDGRAAQASVNIANAPRRVVDGSITAFGQGYAVAYRALSSLGVSEPTIRIAFIDAFGLIVHEAELAQTTESAGPTSVRATARGQLLVSYSTASLGIQAPTRETRALSMDCPGALILCGGTLE